MKSKKKETIKFPSNAAYANEVSRDILSFLGSYNLSETDLFNIRLCIEEAVRNAVEHGNKSDESLPVEVTYGLDGDELEITVEDKGNGFDLKSLPDPSRDENIMQERGRGVFLIHKLMDEVHFNDKGNRLTMKKRLNQGG